MTVSNNTILLISITGVLISIYLYSKSTSATNQPTGNSNTGGFLDPETYLHVLFGSNQGNSVSGTPNLTA